QAARFTRTAPELARVGADVTIRLRVITTTFLPYLRIVEAIPADTELVSAPGSNELVRTNLAANSTLDIEYVLRLPDDQVTVFGDAVVEIEPIGLTRESFNFPLSIITFRAEDCDPGERILEGCTQECLT